MNELLCAYLFARVCEWEEDRVGMHVHAVNIFYAWTDPEGYMNLICDMFDIIISFIFVLRK